jgi:hypothetical protein
MQSTNHSGLRMSGYQSANVYKKSGSHKHDPSFLGGTFSSAVQAGVGMKPTFVCANLLGSRQSTRVDKNNYIQNVNKNQLF